MINQPIQLIYFKKDDRSVFKKSRVSRINRSKCMPSVKKCEILMKLIEEHFNFVMNRPTKLVEEEHFDFIVSLVRTKQRMAKMRLETNTPVKH